MNTKYFKESLIGDLTLTAIELVENTDLMNINDIENSCCTIKIDDRYEVDIRIDYVKNNGNAPTDWYVWFNLIEDNCSSVILAEDSKNISTESIRQAVTEFVDSLIRFKIITAE